MVTCCRCRLHCSDCVISNSLCFAPLLLQGELDEQALFAEPVADAFPEVALAYSAIVTNPMDFQTIKEDRLRVYQSVAELQHDLILVFDNCIAFNGGDSEFGQMAL